MGVYRAQEEKDYIAKKPSYFAALILGDVGDNAVVQRVLAWLPEKHLMFMLLVWMSGTFILIPPHL